MSVAPPPAPDDPRLRRVRRCYRLFQIGGALVAGMAGPLLFFRAALLPVLGLLGMYLAASGAQFLLLRADYALLFVALFAARARPGRRVIFRPGTGYFALLGGLLLFNGLLLCFTLVALLSLPKAR